MKTTATAWILAIMTAWAAVPALAADQKKNSKDELFQLDDEEVETTPKPTAAQSAPAKASAKKEQKSGADSGVRWSGFLQEELARAYQTPAHWSKVLTRGQLTGQGEISSGLKWKASGRLDYDAVFDLTNHYSDTVRDNRRLDFQFRETYLDFSTGGLDFRLGRQHIVWGEMVGLFFADVVSARDSREFILPEFEIQRIPQWALRAEHFKDNWHSEFIWIPYATVDEFGKPGDDFYPTLITAPGMGVLSRADIRPAHSLRNSNAGLRIGVLSNGWDVAGFYYSSVDATPHFTRTIENLPGPTVVYTPRHSRIWQAGGTLAKDFGDFVLKGETIYTRGRKFSVTDFSDADGVVKQNLLDYALGLDFSLREQDLRFNVQAFQRVFLNHVDSLIPRKTESGASLLVAGKYGDVSPQVLFIRSLNRNDWLLRPSADWQMARNLRLRGGFDVFFGPSTGLFGQYADRDRVYAEIKYSY